MNRAIDFYFDFLSPYSYLAWTQIHALAAHHGREVRATPILLAALLAHSGTLGPAEIPLKRTYVFKDALRNAKLLGMPFEPPNAHPFNPLASLRVAGLPVAPDVQRRMIDALFRAVWVEGANVESADAVARVLERAGLDARSLVAAATAPEAKDRLRAATDAAIAAGVFGVPSMIAEGELFWGCDSLPHLERFLEGRDPIAGTDITRYLAVRASAKR